MKDLWQENMHKISFLEIAPVFSNQVKLPYSTGVIWSHCLTNNKIKNNFELHKWIYIHENEDDIFKELIDSDIVGVSNFVWNENINNSLCKRLKNNNNKIKIVYGGLGTPNDAEIFLKKNKFVDAVVNGEGEYAFENLLMDYLCDDMKKIYKAERVSNIEELPSPYLNGLFDDLISKKNHNYNFEALIEPSRGCPYKCTFCEIGDDYFTKLKKQSVSKIYNELEWISNKKIEYLHIIDNNFGMIPLHKNISEKLVELKTKNGYPNALNLTWAKNKKKLLFDIIDILKRAELQKGITIALQSLNEPTLQAIKRSNLDSVNLKNLFHHFEKSNTPTYIELIMGLPMETTQQFKDNVYYILDDLDYPYYIGMYPLSALPNTKFNDKDYIKKYDIKFKDTCPAFYHHESTRDMLRSEKERMVVSNSVMTIDEYIELLTWKWFLMTFHFLGWLSIMSKMLKRRYDISLKVFYENFYKYIKSNKNFLHDEYKNTKNLISKVFRKKEPWGRKIEDVSSIYWEYEEATSIIIARKKDEFYQLVKDYMYEFYTWDYNKKYNIDDIIHIQFKKMKNPGDDVEKWAIECLWWGRTNEKFFNE